ncbi:MAG TPA: prepilin-type N-terminal cleavage/methylation domain-containing protein [Thermoanaerobaculia bacterium]|nr:prepilin-type N-terminal cleavage/methylation domain-containing protein [Thermoanaerobaculia bacterium]
MRSQKGFSLVELLAALVVLTIVVTTTLAVFVERKKRLNQASETILAYQVLANEAEMQRRVPFDSLLSSKTFLSSTELLMPLDPYTLKVDVDAAKAGIKDVTMSITWIRGKATRVASLRLERVDTGGVGNLW